MEFLPLLAGLYLAWGIGANDSSKVFAPAVATGTIRYRTAVLCIAVFALAGTLVQGHTLYDAFRFSAIPIATRDAGFATGAAAFAVMIMTILGMPISTSQAGVGGMIGITVARHGWGALDLGTLKKMGACWIVTPPFGAILAYLLYRVLAPLLDRALPNLRARSQFLRYGLILFGCYEAFTLGANNVVVTTGPFYQAGLFGPPGADAFRGRFIAAGLGGMAISVGALTFAARVMETFGRKVTVLDPYSAWIVAISTGATMQIFTFLHVPVSITQAGIGALIGVGLTKGTGALSLPTLLRIHAAWVISPVSAGLCAWALGKVF